MVVITVPTIIVLVLIAIVTLTVVIIVMCVRRKAQELKEDYYSEVGPPPLPMRMDINHTHRQGDQTFRVPNISFDQQNPTIASTATEQNENLLEESEENLSTIYNFKQPSLCGQQTGCVYNCREQSIWSY